MSTVPTIPKQEGPQFRLRWSRIDGPELRCQHCGEWWSIGPDARDYWVVGKWAMCRMCVREADRLFHAKKAADDDAFRRRGIERLGRYRDWMIRNHPDLVRALNREYAARHRARCVQYRADRKREAA